MKKLFSQKLLLLCLAIFLVLFSASFLDHTHNSSNEENHIDKILTILPDNPNNPYVSGVIPHHLVAETVIDNFFQELSKENSPKEIIILSPDHFNAAAVHGNTFISVNAKRSSLEDLSIDTALLKDISGLAFSDYSVKKDHGITNTLPFIKDYFPDSKIVPLLIPANLSLDQAEKTTEELHQILSSDAFVLASVDFSHYFPKEVADFHDIKSMRVLTDFEKENFSNIEVDCPQCLFMARYFAELKDANNPVPIDHKNSQDFNKGSVLDSTTSYFSVLFSKQITEQTEPQIETEVDQSSQTILFVGDIMLDRAVKRLMEKNNYRYPFEKTRDFLRGVDLVVGNLEGPIVKYPQETPDFSMRFNFGSVALNSLQFSGINLVSLANNHTSDRGELGLERTKEFLDGVNIDHFGDPKTCEENNIYTTDEAVFVGINLITPDPCSNEEIENLIQIVKKENADKFIIVYIHWGNEYKESGNWQQKELAHLMIDSGVDLIIGSHPHVVQEIEQYDDKLIFYSLGNFIFDQYFSQETQEGLAVGLELSSDEMNIYLFPTGSYRSQPYLFDNAEKTKFLNNLSSKSSPELKEQITKGIIEIGR